MLFTDTRVDPHLKTREFVKIYPIQKTPTDGDPIKLPENLETLPRAEHFPTQRHRWNTNESVFRCCRGCSTCTYRSTLWPPGKYTALIHLAILQPYSVREYPMRMLVIVGMYDVVQMYALGAGNSDPVSINSRTRRERLNQWRRFASSFPVPLVRADNDLDTSPLDPDPNPGPVAISAGPFLLIV
ncbi:hypothetical protein KQX54_013776 [Cotesia glomerata]|uniref:Uncharacterized protein n=1 Tax=Cotesia glomerata TaxID=32391 RepID=A0AAV7IKH3_COTGL|nr:hypothetical protein KQX54_013776 [Cotesia glomerata]